MANEATWETSDLLRRLCSILDFASRTIGLLAKEAYRNPDEPGTELPPEKITGETAFLLLIADSCAGMYKDVKERIEKLAALLIPYARSTKVLLEICLQPTFALDYAQAHICLSRIGYADKAFDKVLAKAISAQAHHGRERPPHRMLEQEWIRKIGGLNTADTNENAMALACSVLSKPVDLLNGTRDDMYAFTHALMYVTGFNLFPWQLPRDRIEILGEAEALLARCLDEQDYDLAGELLLAWPLTDAPWNAIAIFAFQVLCAVEDEAGFLPASSTRLESLQNLEGENRKRYFHATAYHTVYVMGLLCAVTLQAGRTPSQLPPTPSVTQESAQQLMPYLEQHGSHPHWYKEYTKHVEKEQNGLTRLLFYVALHRSVRQRQYHRIYDLLQLGLGLGVTDTALSSQSAELLERLALLSSVESSNRLVNDYAIT